jgi:glycosyltransferase involved in cell wall biosynthesis
MKKRVCIIVSAEITVKAFLTDCIAKILEKYEVDLIANTKNPGLLKAMIGAVTVIPMEIERKINITHDLSTLYLLHRHFSDNHYDLIHSFTPKAGLLSMVSGKAAGIPIRIHTFTGQVWANKGGLSRSVLKLFDRLSACCSTHILVDSFSQRDFIVNEKVVVEHKTRVIANGSICGVDTTKFKHDVIFRNEIRKSHTIPESDIVFLFLGRLTMDKGIMDLVEAFSEINKKYLNTHLMIVGPDEEGMKKRVIEICKSCSDNLHFENYTDTPEKFMTAADVFCLPSYREGFGMTIIEAGSVGIPSIGTRIYGITDAIEEGITGYLYAPHNAEELASKMLIMVEKPDMRKQMGMQARERVKKSFSKELVTTAFVDFYDALLNLQNMKN